MTVKNATSIGSWLVAMKWLTILSRSMIEIRAFILRAILFFLAKVDGSPGRNIILIAHSVSVHRWQLLRIFPDKFWDFDHVLSTMFICVFEVVFLANFVGSQRNQQ
jgi:hypothetical protein